MFTYDPSLSSNRDRLRCDLQDNVEETAVLQDAEIDGYLRDYGFVGAFQRCASVLASFWAQKVSSYQEGSGGTLSQFADRVKHYEGLVEDAKNGLILDPDATMAAPRTGVSVGMAIAPDMRKMRTD